MKPIKIIFGVLLLLAGLRNLTDVFNLPNARQAAGYLTVTLFFILLGGWLFYSGIRPKMENPKIYDHTDSDQA